MTGPHDLRSLLEDVVSRVEPAPALDRIRERTKVSPMSSKRPWMYAAAGAVVATAATVTAVTVLADDGPGRDAAIDPAATATSDPTPTSEATPTTTPEPSERPPSPAGEDARVTLPVYYVTDTDAGPRLVREFHRLAGSADHPAVEVRSALAQAISGTPLDGDYRSPWPSATTVLGVTVVADQVEIDLSGTSLGDRPAGTSEEEAGMAVQQLVHTAQGVVQDRVPVRILLDGEPTDTVLGVPAAEPLTAGDPMAVQAPVWITSPQEGDVVDGTFTVEGRGAFFEANVSWQLLAGGEVVEEGFDTAQECCTLSPYSFEVTAEPGDYVLRVYSADQSGGEGFELEDTKAITVR